MSLTGIHPQNFRNSSPAFSSYICHVVLRHISDLTPSYLVHPHYRRHFYRLPSVCFEASSIVVRVSWVFRQPLYSASSEMGSPRDSSNEKEQRCSGVTQKRKLFEKITPNPVAGAKHVTTEGSVHPKQEDRF